MAGPQEPSRLQVVLGADEWLEGENFTVLPQQGTLRSEPPWQCLSHNS